MDFEQRFKSDAVAKLQARLLANLNALKFGPLGDAMKRAAARYLGFIRRRYVGAARGDGTWPDLAASTKLSRARRTKAGRRSFAKKVKSAGAGDIASGLNRSRRRVQLDVISGMQFEILRDTGLTLNSLSQGAASGIQEILPLGIRVGTAVAYAQYHQDGDGVPQRTILVPPDDDTKQQIDGEVMRGLNAAITDAVKGQS